MAHAKVFCLYLIVPLSLFDAKWGCKNDPNSSGDLDNAMLPPCALELTHSMHGAATSTSWCPLKDPKPTCHQQFGPIVGAHPTFTVTPATLHHKPLSPTNSPTFRRPTSTCTEATSRCRGGSGDVAAMTVRYHRWKPVGYQ